MATILFANNATTTLAGPLTSTATTANVAAGTGVLFPQPGAGQLFKLTLTDAATGLLNEIVHVTAVNGDAFTIQRGQENTSPQSWLAGDLADNLPTAGTFAALAQTAAITAGAFQGTDSGTSPNTMVVANTTPSLSAPVQGQYFEIVKSAQSNTGPVTLTIGSGGSAASVVYKDGTALGPSEWPANAAAILYFTGGVYQFLACQGAPAIKVYNGGTDTGSADALVVAPVPSVPALTDNVELFFVKSGNANATATPTLKVSSQTAQPIVRRDGAALAAGDLPASTLLSVKYDVALGKFRLIGTAASQIASTPNPTNTQISSNTNAALSLQGSQQTLQPSSSQFTTVMWNTNIVPAAIGTYNSSTGGTTMKRAGWYDITAAATISAGSNHSAYDFLLAQAQILINFASGAASGGQVVTNDAPFFPPNATGGGPGGAFVKISVGTPSTYLSVGDVVYFQIMVNNFYTDAANIVVGGQANMQIQFLNP